MKKIFITVIFAITFLSFFNITYSAQTKIGPGKWKAHQKTDKGGGINKGGKIDFSVNSSYKSKVVTENVGCSYEGYNGWNGYSCVFTTEIEYTYFDWNTWQNVTVKTPCGIDENGYNTCQCISCSRTYTQYYSEPTYCPAGQVLIKDQRNKPALGLSAGTLICIVEDEDAPDINLDFNGYEHGTWTNKNVNVSVNVTDNGTGIKKVSYSVNGGTVYNTGSSFQLKFEEEGIYNLLITAEDKSTHYSQDGTPSSSGNIVSENFTIKIDKKAPVINDSSKEYIWSKTKVLNFSISDNYKGELSKLFKCTDLPENANWISPATSDGSIYGTCNPEDSNCSNDNGFEPNLIDCKYKCNAGYTLGSDKKCYQTTKQFSCNSGSISLPKEAYMYSLTNTLTLSDKVDNISKWISPTQVGLYDGLFNATFLPASNSYAPSLNDCNYSCDFGFHKENGKCVDDSAIICCQKDYPLATSKTVGAVVDCTLAINADNVACVYNSTCGGYVKDVFKSWETNRWVYESEGVVGINTLTEACGMENLANSDGFTCNPKFYLVNGGLPGQSCEPVAVGEWSGQENEKRACTNKPNNAYYTSNGDNNNCNWTCNDKFTKIGGVCKGDTRDDQLCSAKPANTDWNKVWKIDQTWNGSSRIPSLISKYNTNSSYSECRFECKDNYTWDGDSCNADKKYNQSCTGLPDDAKWNDTDKITQTWDGSKWLPSTIGVYNTSSSNTECRFECKTGKTWDSVKKECK